MVTGLYRYVRNPVYIAVVAVILGQAILFGDWRLMTYGGFMLLAFHAFVLAYEEPVLAQQFGVQYEDFRARPAVDSAAVSMAHRLRLPANQWRKGANADARKPAAHNSTCSNSRRSRRRPTICFWNFQREF